jgi:hypothetical protein
MLFLPNYFGSKDFDIASYYSTRLCWDKNGKVGPWSTPAKKNLVYISLENST